jgi:hypothetical protein
VPSPGSASVPSPGSASVPRGSITAIYNEQMNRLHVWWTRPDSSVKHIMGAYSEGRMAWRPHCLGQSITAQLVVA